MLTKEEKAKRDELMLASAKRVVALIGGNLAVRKVLREHGLPICRVAIHRWPRVPPNKVEILNKASGYRVTKHQMRPDVWLTETEKCQS